jgi:hypothetical protein
VHRWSKDRPFNRLGTLALLGLAICVFTWGLQYKLSLYDPSQVSSHRIPIAKLLSRDERSGPEEGSPAVRANASATALCAVSIAAFFLLLLLPGLPKLQASGEREERASRSWRLRRAFLNKLFVRAPPVLV